MTNEPPYAAVRLLPLSVVRDTGDDPLGSKVGTPRNDSCSSLVPPIQTHAWRRTHIYTHARTYVHVVAEIERCQLMIVVMLTGVMMC